MTSFKDHWQGQARACAKGHKQLAFVNELIDGDSYFSLESIPGKPWIPRVPVYGDTKLEFRSYKNLEKRLNRAGFQVVTEYSKTETSAKIRLI